MSLRRKILTVLGTRPEIIRLSSLIGELDKNFDHRIIFTGQNYDSNLSDVFFDQLGIRAPDLRLEAGKSSLAESLGIIFKKVEEEIINWKPDAFLVLGDTNSALSSIVAKRMGVIVYHLEAGNRSFDANVPEEVNRKIIDHSSDFNLVYTESSRRNLLSEGFEARRVSLSGSPIPEVLNKHRDKISNSEILSELNLSKDSFILASVHRQENVNLMSRRESVFESLNNLGSELNLEIILSTHPRTRSQLSNSVELRSKLEHIRFEPPFGYFDYMKLQQNAYCVVSDSGTVSEEALYLGFPAVTIRDSTERPEAIETGGIIMSGLEPSDLISAVKAAKGKKISAVIPEGYGFDDFSDRVANFVLSTIHASHGWSGYRTAT